MLMVSLSDTEDAPEQGYRDLSCLRFVDAGYHNIAMGGTHIDFHHNYLRDTYAT